MFAKVLIANRGEIACRAIRTAANNCRAVAFPAISTGVYRCPKDDATEIAVSTVAACVDRNTVPAAVTFCCFDLQMAELYRQTVAVFRGA